MDAVQNPDAGNTDLANIRKPESEGNNSVPTMAGGLPPDWPQLEGMKHLEMEGLFIVWQHS